MKNINKRLIINIITLSRIFLIPCFFFLKGISAFLLLNLLFITDYIDGYLARKYNLTSKEGAILDLLGDKLLTIFLLTIYTIRGDLLVIVSLLLIIREVYSIGMRIYYIRKDKGLIEASMFGKVKTALFFISFDMLILNLPGYQIMFLIILVISYYSLFTYIKEGVNR